MISVYLRLKQIPIVVTMSTEAEKAAEEEEEWSTVEKPSKANRRLAPQKMLTKSDFVETVRPAEQEKRGKL